MPVSVEAVLRSSVLYGEHSMQLQGEGFVEDGSHALLRGRCQMPRWLETIEGAGWVEARRHRPGMQAEIQAAKKSARREPSNISASLTPYHAQFQVWISMILPSRRSTWRHC